MVQFVDTIFSAASINAYELHDKRRRNETVRFVDIVGLSRCKNARHHFKYDYIKLKRKETVRLLVIVVSAASTNANS